MGLKDDLINAKIEGLKIAGAKDEDIDSNVGSAIEVQAELEKEAIAKFLTNVEFKITELKANVILENFAIPSQQGDVLPQVVSMDIPWPGGVPGGATPVPLQGGTNGVLNKPIDVGKAFGGLRSDGYVFIGADPDSQDSFDSRF